MNQNLSKSGIRLGIVLLFVFLGGERLEIAAQEAQTLNQARGLIKEGKYPQAEILARELLAEAEVTFGADSLKTAEVLDVLVESLYRGGKAKQPEWHQFAERAIAIKKNILGPDHPEVAVSLNNLAIILNISGDYAGAKPLFEQALAIREKALAPDHPEVARSLNNLANLLRNIGNFAEAKPLYERALQIREKAFGPNHPEVAITLNNLAILLKDMGDYAGARLLYERTLAIRENTLGPEHPEVTIALNNLANLLMESGDYVGARPLHQRSLAIREKSQGPTHPFTAVSLMNLANLLRNLGDYAGATPLYQRAIEIQEKALGADHHDVARTIENFAILLLYSGEYARARPLYERSLAIMEKTFGPNHPEVAVHLDDLAELLRVTGDFAEARSLFERALAIREKALGPDHWRVASSLDNLASLFIAIGDYAKARPLSERALSIWEKSFGPNYHYAANSLYDLARLFYKTGEAAKALDAALRAEQITREHFRLTARTLAERQALGYAATRTSGLGLALSIVSEGGVMDSTQRAFDALIRTRSLVLDEMASRHRAVSSANDSGLVRLSQTLASARQRLANLTVRGAGDDDLDRYLRLLAEARQEKERAEQALAEKSAAFRQEQARSRIGFAEVAAHLDSNQTLVAFAYYSRYANDTTIKAKAAPSYLAFILRAQEQQPLVVPLGQADEIETLISAWGEEAARGLMQPGRSAKRAEAAYRSAGEKLRKKIWDPIASRLSGLGQVFVVPDGELNLVNFAALPRGEKDYLVESGPMIHYLSAERDLVPVEDLEKGAGLLALGNPAFDETAMFAALGPKLRKPRTTGATQKKSAAYRGERSGCGDFQSMRFESLPASAREVKEIVSLWGKDRAAIHLNGAQASEAAFKEQAPGQKILHLATHGYFLGGGCASALESSRGVGGVKAVKNVSEEPRPVVAGENPLLLSGLVLAGANHREQARLDEEDGILTAEEIAAMDLSGVEWAVLSACETGVGKIEAGEGVFGLRRAFQVAGARTLIMSLWSVADESARQWMAALYEGRLVKNLSTAESVRAASLEVLRSRREKGQSTHPFFWAGFVAAGDWR